MTVIRAGLMLLAAFAVLAHGAVEPWSQAILFAGAASLFLVWGFVQFTHRRIDLHWSPLCFPMLAFGGLALAQWLLGFSVYPYLTRIELLKLFSLFLLFFLAFQVFQRLEDVRPMIWFLIGFGFCTALFGIIQFFSFNGKIYWMRELRFGGFVFGPYVNHNHFAGLMELVLPLSLALLFQRVLPMDKLLLVGVLAAFSVGALFLSGSRGGIVTFLAQLGLLAFFATPGRGRRGKWAAVVAFVLVAAALTVWVGVGSTLERFVPLQQGDLSQEGRVEMFSSTFKVFLAYPWLGAGMGTLSAIYPQFAAKDLGARVDHAHNDYLEMMAETGLAGTACSIVFAGLLLYGGFSSLSAERNRLASAIRLGALVSCFGLLLHGLVDFNFHIPSNAMLFFILAAIATRKEILLPAPRDASKATPTPVVSVVEA